MEEYQEHISKYVKKLLQTDTHRFHHIIEIIEYSILYALFAGVVALGIEMIFPVPDDQKSTARIVFEVLLQCIASALAVYYIRKIVKIVPYIFEGSSSYVPHNISEYEGELMIAIVFLGLQTNLVAKLYILRERFIMLKHS